MSKFDEANTVQAAVVDRLSQSDLGWQFVAADQLDRHLDEVLIESEVAGALKRLNPLIAQEPGRVEEIFPKLRAVILSVVNDGLVASNQKLMSWLRGTETHKFVGVDDYEPIRLIDYTDPRANSLVVSSEVTYRAGTETRRYDVVLWVNGIPIVVGETKTPISFSVSWLDGAIDIHNAYEVKTPGFFVPNVLSFATEGKEFRYGAIRQPPETWLPWSRTTDELAPPGLSSVLRAVELLLAPEMLLDIIRTYTLYSTRSTSHGAKTIKVIPRYPQVEAVEAIVERVKDPAKKKGLIWHHQGSGKTLLMAFAAARLRQTLELDAPTILIVLDRLDLIEQVASEFSSVGLAGMKVAKTRDELSRMLSEDTRGIIVTTIFRFADAGLLNERSNIVVMVDEAHRTQEGRLAADMREALPNAKFIGLTGTPISTKERNTWETFGDPDDPEGVLNAYPFERSIADGATLPVHVETRLVDFQIDSYALDQAFDELVEEERLDEEEQGLLVREASRIETIMRNPTRIEAVCSDIVSHYREKIAPLGLKAQVVAASRELCVAYFEAISSLLRDGEEATVVMTCAKDDPAEWSAFDRERDAEIKVRNRFLDPDDPLCFLIVTAKLLTGFDAPVEGVMYLDKPLRAHTLFQAITRTNRRWTNPATGQEKLHGLIVDYVGLGNELAKALAMRDTGAKKALPADTDELITVLAEQIGVCASRFEGVSRDGSGFEQLVGAQEKLRDPEAKAGFAEEFLRVQGLFEFLWPATRLRPVEDDYRWLAKIYKSVYSPDISNKLLWIRLGAKTEELIAEHLSDVTVSDTGLEEVAVDAEIIEAMEQLGLFPAVSAGGSSAPPSAAEVMATLESRLAAKLSGGKAHAVYESLAERLEELRRSKVGEARASVEFLKRLLEIARELVEAERHEAEGTLDAMPVLPDPHIGALSQILKEYAPPDTPVIVERVVEDIDAIVRPVKGSGWQTSQPGDREVRRQLRATLNRHGLPAVGELYDRAYAYIREHY
ncbi:MAG: type I restriction endonuclease subunit R [Acidobacteria bacterium]|nr:MAG: type I restriction endonuclease subunit R [Acidobacteriota bacterium]